MLDRLLNKDVDYETDSTLNPQKKEDNGNEFQELLNKKFIMLIQNPNGRVDVIVAMKKLFGLNSPDCPIFDDNVSLSSDMRKDMENAKKICFNYCFHKARGLFEKALAVDDTRRVLFKHRTEWLETARELIADNCLGIYKPSDNPVCIAICHYYLAGILYERAINILPRTEKPPKHKEGDLLKAEAEIRLADALCELKKDWISTEITKKHAEILHELYRIKPELYLEAFLKKNTALFDDLNYEPVSENDFILYHFYRLHGGSKRCIDILNASPRSTVHKENIEIYKTYEALRIYDLTQKNTVYTHLKAACRQMRKFNLYSRAWDDFIELLKDMERNPVFFDGPLLMPILYKAWLFVEARQRKMHMGFQIRQYWGRLQPLYHMTIRVALNLEKPGPKELKQAVRVIDSLKGKTPAMWNHIIDALKEANKTDEAEAIQALIDHFFSNEWTASLKKFVEVNKPYESLLKKFIRSSSNNQTRSYKTLEIPDGWASVHFYLDQTDKPGQNWVVICKKTSGYPPVLCKKPIDARELAHLKKTYDDWLSEYRTLPNKADSGKSLKAMCAAIGATFPFLHEIAENFKLIFVPHGMLHRIPLHGAFDGTSYLFEKTNSTYLPAWSMAFKPVPEDNTNNQKILLQYLEENDPAKSVDPGPLSLDIWDVIRDPAEKADLIDLNCPRILVLICHGLAHLLDPFKSKIMLGKDGITLLELFTIIMNITGTRLYMGICETEMTPNRDYWKIDEHISIASVFLSQRCREILGTLWESNVVLTGHLIKAFVQCDGPAWEELTILQTCWHYMDDDEIINEMKSDAHVSSEHKLYYILPYRFTGYPHQ